MENKTEELRPRTSGEWALHVDFWDAINEYVASCGGDTSERTVSDRRMHAVVGIEDALRAWKKAMLLEYEKNEKIVRLACVWAATPGGSDEESLAYQDLVEAL